jgi:hypothetical protein
MQKRLLLLSSLIVAACGLSAQAILPSDNDPFQLSIPNLKGGVELNAGGMLAKPSGGQTNSETISPSVNSGPVQANAGSGLSAGGGYGISGSGNDVQVQWNSAK